MSPRDVTAIIIFGIIFGSIMITAIARAFLRRPPAADRRQLQDIAERLAHLEQSVDAIAVETERISEGQRFTTRLLSEKSTQETR